MKTLIRSIFTSIRVNIGRLKGGQVSIGNNSFIERGVFFSAKRNIRIGTNTYIGRNASLSCHVDIANDVLVASNVSFVGGDHRIDNINTNINISGRDEIKCITVESNVWIGHGVIVMHGVTLHSGSVIAAGSIVTKDVPENAIFGGNPAKLIRYRKLSNFN